MSEINTFLIADPRYADVTSSVSLAVKDDPHLLFLKATPITVTVRVVHYIISTCLARIHL